MDFKAELKQLETLLSSLEDQPALTTSQLKALQTITNLIKEGDAELKRHSQATRSRRKAARTLLRTIYEGLGDTILFLCSIAFPITKLNEINRQASTFVSRLRDWSDTIEIQHGAASLVHLHFSPALLSLLSTQQAKRTKRAASFDTSPARRLRAESSMGKGQAIPNLHGVLGLSSSRQPVETPIDDDGEVIDDGDGNENGAIDESDGDCGQASDHPRQMSEDDVPLYSNVYELDGMDAIRVIASQADVICRLTMPHFPDSTPFITIQCPYDLAMEFLTKRNKIKW